MVVLTQTQTFFLKWAADQICRLSRLSQPYCHRCCCSASSSQPPLPPFCFFFTAQLSLLVLLLLLRRCYCCCCFFFFFFFFCAIWVWWFIYIYNIYFLYTGLMIFFFGIMGIMIHICLMSLGSKFLYMSLMSLDLNLGWFWWICRDAGIREKIDRE